MQGGARQPSHPGSVAMRYATLTALLVAAAASPAAAQPRPMPRPRAVLGFRPGADRRLVDWRTIVAYFRALSRASDRVTVREIGRSTDGAPFIVAFISSPTNLAHLSRLGEIQRRLADPRLVRDSAVAERLVRTGKVFTLITSSIHSTEVGGFFSPLLIAYRLAARNTPAVRRILENTVIILVPSLNPDGVTLVSRWYRETLGTPAEGTRPPELYNRYTGHDDNRDWYAFTQIETRLTVDSLYDVWHPQITLDLHQQGRFGSRLFLPPYIGPTEPNVDPLLVQAENALGLAVAWRLTAEGLTGIAVHSTYDAWTPGRAFEHYHGAVRILSETAGAMLATPVSVPFDSLRAGMDVDPRVRSWNFPAPWLGGTWSLADIVHYQSACALALLDQVARNRDWWLRTGRAVADRAIHGWSGWPFGFVIPTAGQNPAALGTLLEILRHAQVEVRAALGSFSIAGERFFPGTYVVPLRQPYAAFAAAMLERRGYPEQRLYPGGPLRHPYDVTAHALPLLLGVRVLALADSPSVSLSAPVTAPAPVYRVAGLSAGPPGSPARVRIGIYRSYVPTPDEGWTRWVLHTWAIPYASVVDSEVRDGRLRDRFDALVLPSEDPRAILNGLPVGRYPPQFTGGLTRRGVRALRDFVDEGGTLIALNQACDFAIGALDLPVTDALVDASPKQFSAPGSLLRLELESGAPLAAGMPPETAGWFEAGPAFDVRDPARVRVVARYPADSVGVLLSGWLAGASWLAGRAALVDVQRGNGHVILFGFRPQYRGQSLATFPLLFNALKSAASR